MTEQTLQTIIQSHLGHLYTGYEAEIKLDIPTNPDHGDYAISTPLSLAKRYQQSPITIANQIVDSLKMDNDFNKIISKTEVISPGFVNFTLNNAWLMGAISDGNQISDVHPGKPGLNQKIMVEYSSPNIAKPFNVGHLRSTIIGDSLANVYQYLGYEVIRDNHLGDWGTQYGKLAYAVEQWGDWAKIEANPIPELFQLYVRINEETKDNPELQEQARAYFKKLEDGDPHVRKLWQKLSDLSIADFNQLYHQFNVHFDIMLGESFYEPFLLETIQECIAAGIAVESQGALVINFDDPKIQNPPLMIRKSNGTTTYATRDLAGIKYRFNHYQLDKLIIEIGNEQEYYFKQVIAAAEKMGWIKPGQLIHVGHGLFLGDSGKKLSTRKGETVWLRDLVAELEQKALQIVSQKSPDLSESQHQDIARKVSIGALKYNDLSQNRLSNITFDKDKALSLEGNSSPYLQYTIARAKSILRQVEGRAINPQTDGMTDNERKVMLAIIQFNQAVEQVAAEHYPSYLTTLLYQIAQRFNAFYQTDPILQAEPNSKTRRLQLTEVTSNTLSLGLKLLGIEVPDRM